MASTKPTTAATRVTATAIASSSGSNMTSGGAEADRAEFDRVWEKLQNIVIEMAGGDKTKIKTGKQIDELVASLDGSPERAEQARNDNAEKEKREQQRGKLAKKDKKDSKYDEEIKGPKRLRYRARAKAVVSVIQTVGNTVVAGVGSAYPPVETAWNAFAFVLQAWQDYDDMFDDLLQELDDCVFFLDCFENYREVKDLRLMRHACETLELFVEICGTIVDLRRKRAKAYAFSRQLFMKENAAQGYRERLDRLTDREKRLSITLSLKLVAKTQADLELQRQKGRLKDWRKKLAIKLGFSDNALNRDDEPVRTWQSALSIRKDNLIDGMGSWIVQTMSSRNGRTLLMASLLKALRNKDQANGTSPSHRVVTAFFFCQPSRRKSDSAKDNDEKYGPVTKLLDDATAVLLWQLSTEYEAMTRSVGSIIDQVKDTNAIELWTQLFFDASERQNEATTFLVFIDAPDGQVDELRPLIKMFHEDSRKNSRLFITATPETVESWTKLRRSHSNNQGIDFDTICISDHNDCDVDAYIENRLKDIPKLADEGTGMEERRGEISRTLRSKCGKNYLNLGSALEQLKDPNVKYDKDIERILETAGTPLSFNSIVLSDHEIQELNEITLWVDSARQWLTVDEMEFVVALENWAGSGFGGPRNKWYLPFLREQLKKYSEIFKVTDDRNLVKWRSDETPDMLRVGRPLSKVTGLAKPAEIDIIRYSIHNFCPPELYERLRFDDLFEGRLVPAANPLVESLKDHIYRDEASADIKIALRCLKILTEKDLYIFMSMCRYASEYLFDHLKAVDLSTADPELKRQIGPLLVKLFTDTRAIDALFWPYSIGMSRQQRLEYEGVSLLEQLSSWVYSMEGVRLIRDWFADRSVIEAIEDEEGQRLVTNVANAAEMNLHEVLLSRAAEHMATHLFWEVTLAQIEVGASCAFLNGYLMRTNPATAKYMSEFASEYLDSGSDHHKEMHISRLSLDRSEAIETWARDRLSSSLSSRPNSQFAMWEANAAHMAWEISFMRYMGASQQENDEAVEDIKKMAEIARMRARTAMNQDPENWLALYLCGSAHWTRKDESVKILTAAKDGLKARIEAGGTWSSHRMDRCLLARIMLDLGNLLWKSNMANERDKAAAVHRESLEYFCTDFIEYVAVLIAYFERKAWNEVNAFVEKLNQCTEVWYPALSGLFTVRYYSDGITVDIFAQAANVCGWGRVMEFFNLAAAEAKKQKRYQLLFSILEAYGNALSRAIGNSFARELFSARQEAWEVLNLHLIGYVPDSAVTSMAGYLAESYLNRARAAGMEGKDTAKYHNHLAALVQDAKQAWTNTTPVCCLLLYEDLIKAPRSDMANNCIQAIIRDGIDLLSDDYDSNDFDAFNYLNLLFTTLEDVENMNACWAMRSILMYHGPQQQRLRSIAEGKLMAGPPDAADEYGFGIKMQDSESRVGQAAVDAVVTPGIGLEQEDTDEKDEEKDSEKRGVEEKGNKEKEEDRDGDTSSSDGNSDTSEGESEYILELPDSMVWCDGCDKEWPFVTISLFTCVDCGGRVQLDTVCHDRLMEGTLDTSGREGLTCSKEHKFLPVPVYTESDLSGSSPNIVPAWAAGSSREGGTGTSITMDEWKNRLRSKYLI